MSIALAALNPASYQSLFYLAQYIFYNPEIKKSDEVDRLEKKWKEEEYQKALKFIELSDKLSEEEKEFYRTSRQELTLKYYQENHFQSSLFSKNVARKLKDLPYGHYLANAYETAVENQALAYTVGAFFISTGNILERITARNEARYLNEDIITILQPKADYNKFQELINKIKAQLVLKGLTKFDVTKAGLINKDIQGKGVIRANIHRMENEKMVDHEIILVSNVPEIPGIINIIENRKLETSLLGTTEGYLMWKKQVYEKELNLIAMNKPYFDYVLQLLGQNPVNPSFYHQSSEKIMSIILDTFNRIGIHFPEAEELSTNIFTDIYQYLDFTKIGNFFENRKENYNAYLGVQQYSITEIEHEYNKIIKGLFEYENHEAYSKERLMERANELLFNFKTFAEAGLLVVSIHFLTKSLPFLIFKDKRDALKNIFRKIASKVVELVKREKVNNFNLMTAEREDELYLTLRGFIFLNLKYQDDKTEENQIVINNIYSKILQLCETSYLECQNLGSNEKQRFTILFEEKIISILHRLRTDISITRHQKSIGVVPVIIMMFKQSFTKDIAKIRAEKLSLNEISKIKFLEDRFSLDIAASKPNFEFKTNKANNYFEYEFASFSNLPDQRKRNVLEKTEISMKDERTEDIVNLIQMTILSEPQGLTETEWIEFLKLFPQLKVTKKEIESLKIDKKLKEKFTKVLEERNKRYKEVVLQLIEENNQINQDTKSAFLGYLFENQKITSPDSLILMNYIEGKLIETISQILVKSNLNENFMTPEKIENSLKPQTIVEEENIKYFKGVPCRWSWPDINEMKDLITKENKADFKNSTRLNKEELNEIKQMTTSMSVPELTSSEEFRFFKSLLNETVYNSDPESNYFRYSVLKNLGSSANYNVSYGSYLKLLKKIDLGNVNCPALLFTPANESYLSTIKYLNNRLFYCLYIFGSNDIYSISVDQYFRMMFYYRTLKSSEFVKLYNLNIKIGFFDRNKTLYDIDQTDKFAPTFYSELDTKFIYENEDIYFKAKRFLSKDILVKIQEKKKENLDIEFVLDNFPQNEVTSIHWFPGYWEEYCSIEFRFNNGYFVSNHGFLITKQKEHIGYIQLTENLSLWKQEGLNFVPSIQGKYYINKNSELKLFEKTTKITDFCSQLPRKMTFERKNLKLKRLNEYPRYDDNAEIPVNASISQNKVINFLDQGFLKLIMYNNQTIYYENKMDFDFNFYYYFS